VGKRAAQFINKGIALNRSGIDRISDSLSKAKWRDTDRLFHAPKGCDGLSFVCHSRDIGDVDTSAERHLLPETLHALSDLNPAETRFSTAIASGTDLYSFSPSTKVSKETVRNQLKSRL
jgi:hypothetical protein